MQADVDLIAAGYTRRSSTDQKALSERVVGIEPVLGPAGHERLPAHLGHDRAPVADLGDARFSD